MMKRRGEVSEDQVIGRGRGEGEEGVRGGREDRRGGGEGWIFTRTARLLRRRLRHMLNTLRVNDYYFYVELYSRIDELYNNGSTTFNFSGYRFDIEVEERWGAATATEEMEEEEKKITKKEKRDRGSKRRGRGRGEERRREEEEDEQTDDNDNTSLPPLTPSPTPTPTPTTPLAATVAADVSIKPRGLFAFITVYTVTDNNFVCRYAVYI
ncbi:MAG: hypothetical protein QXI43_00245 [Candidatus Nitrosocaldus sp.]